MKRIGFVTSPLSTGHAVRGVGFYTQRLLASLKLQASSHNIEIVENDLTADLVHYPFFDLFSHSLPIFKSAKTVVTVHDVIPLEFPKQYPPGARGWLNLQLQKLALNGVDRVITDSYASVKGIIKYLPVTHDKIRLVYLAADPIFKPMKNKNVLRSIKNKYHLPAKFVLYVGDVNYTKNIPNLVYACKQINLPLVLVGKQSSQIENLDLNHAELRHLMNLDFTGVIRTGFVPDEDLCGIYNLAQVYCQPSFAEGFGLPVLEALACGCPVASSTAHSLPEVGGEAVEYFDPYSVESMAEALVKAKPKNGTEQSSKFSWDKTASDTIMVYNEI